MSSIPSGGSEVPPLLTSSCKEKWAIDTMEESGKVKENGKVFGTLKSLKYKISSIPSGGSEVPHSLTSPCEEKCVIDTMEEFVENFYSFEYSDNVYSIDYTNDSDE